MKHKRYLELYIPKLLKTVGDNSISLSAKQQLNSILINITKTLVEKSTQVLICQKRKILNTTDIENSVNILFPDELAKLAITEARTKTRKDLLISPVLV